MPPLGQPAFPAAAADPNVLAAFSSSPTAVQTQMQSAQQRASQANAAAWPHDAGLPQSTAPGDQWLAQQVTVSLGCT